jgi:bacteriocin-like protein
MTTNTNTDTSATSQINELTDDELDAVNGGAIDSYISWGCVPGGHTGSLQEPDCKGTHISRG